MMVVPPRPRLISSRFGAGRSLPIPRAICSAVSPISSAIAVAPRMFSTLCRPASGAAAAIRSPARVTMVNRSPSPVCSIRSAQMSLAPPPSSSP